MLKKFGIAAAIVAASASVSFAAPFTVDSTGILNPNPSNLTITEVGNTSLAAARTLISAAKTAGTGGVIDFQQRNQGGTFPNSGSATNGVDLGGGPDSPVSVAANGGPTGDGTLGTPIFSFYRAEFSLATNNVFDSNLDQGTNIISGGFQSRYPGAVSATNPLGDGSAVTGVNPAPGALTTSVGGAYFGIGGLSTPATLVFNNPLTFFGLTALPRNASRDSLITLTLSDGSTVTVGGTQLVTTSAVFFGYNTLTSANPLLTISQAVITNPNGAGQNRYDDLAFILAAPAVPEPTTLAALGLGGLAMVRRRRQA